MHKTAVLCQSESVYLYQTKQNGSFHYIMGEYSWKSTELSLQQIKGAHQNEVDKWHEDKLEFIICQVFFLKQRQLKKEQIETPQKAIITRFYSSRIKYNNSLTMSVSDSYTPMKSNNSILLITWSLDEI